jgi:hypothetical protein
MRGAVREAILREEVRDEAIMGRYLYGGLVCRCVKVEISSFADFGQKRRDGRLRSSRELQE